MPFPKTATIAGHPVSVLRPKQSILADGSFFCSHAVSIVKIGGLEFDIPNEMLENVSITDEEIADYEKEIIARLPEAIRLFHAMNGSAPLNTQNT